MYATAFYATFLLATSPGCADKQGVRETDFKSSINDFYAKHLECIRRPKFIFPYSLADDNEDVQLERKLLAHLVANGLLSVDEATVVVQPGLGDFLMTIGSPKPKKKRGKTWKLTEAGREQFADGNLCYGHRQVTEIVRYSEPADMRGRRISNVEYKYEVVDIPKWATAKDAIDLFSTLRAANNSKSRPITAQVDMVLMSDGWTHFRQAM